MGRINRHFARANGAVASASGWITLFGTLAGFLTWASSKLELLAPYGWAEATFIGIGAATVVMLALSAMLVAWRLFRPLAVEIEPANASGELLADDRLEDIVSRLEGIEKNLNTNNRKIAEIQHDLRPVVDVLAEILAHSLLFHSLPEPPLLCAHIRDLTKGTAAEEMKAAAEYSEAVTAALNDTQWGYLVRNANAGAAIQADGFLRSLTADERPNIDPYELRDYCIARTRCDNLFGVITHARREAQSKYRQLLGLMHNRQEANRQRNQQS